MPLIRNAAYNIAERVANVLPLADATVAYQHAALGLSSGRVRPLQSGDTFAGFAGRRVDSRALAAGAPPEQVPIIRAGEALLPIAGSVGASVYATADDTFSTAGGSYIGKVVRLEGAGSWVAFEAQSGGSVPGDGNWTQPASVGVGVGAADVALLGSSIEDGSAADNAGSTSYGPVAKGAANQLRVSRLTRYGYPGQSASYIAAQIGSVLANKPSHVVIGMGFGTNSREMSIASGVYETYGRHFESVVAACRSAGVPVFACTPCPLGIAVGQYVAATSALGTTTTAILPVGASTVDGFYVGGQIDVGDGVVRSIRSYVASTRTATFTPAAASAVASGATVTISGASDSHRGTALHHAWLTTNAPRLGVPVIDMSSLADARGFLQAGYCTTLDGVHPIQAGHNAAGALLGSALNTLVEKIKYPATAFGGASYNPFMVGPASGALPGGYSSVGTTSLGGTRTHTITAAGLGDAPGNTWQCVYDISGGGSAGFQRYLLNPAVSCEPGQIWYVVGTIEGAGAGFADLIAWNGTTSAIIAAVGRITDTQGPTTFAANVTIPAGCTSFSIGTSVTLATGATMTVKAAGIQAIQVSQIATPAA